MSRYRTIVADPPWSYRNDRGTLTGSKRGRTSTIAAGNYPVMGRDAIAALPVEQQAEEASHIYLWVTTPLMFEVDPVGILRGWGFGYVTTLTWVKTGAPGMGFHFRGHTEHCLFGSRGGLKIPSERRRSNVITAPRREHSAKPDAFYDLVEQVSPGPYLEMFARRNRLGWDTWGNECLQHVEMDGAA